ncbi:MAG: sortase [Clostridia bacterium]
MRKKLVKVRKKIPESKIIKVEFSDEIAEIPFEETKAKKNSAFKIFFQKNRYRIQLFVSFIVATISSFIFYLNIKKSSEQEKLSKKLLNNYSLTTIYQDNAENSANAVSYENPFVIGMIRIEKINLNYPILSECNKDLLKISLCRFAGPMPNQTGNLCVAGHNYVDYRFFSRLNELKKGDSIEIYDLAGKKVFYKVYDKFEIDPSDFSCTSQNTNGQKEITLLTCNNVNGKRLVIKAKE